MDTKTGITITGNVGERRGSLLITHMEREWMAHWKSPRYSWTITTKCDCGNTSVFKVRYWNQYKPTACSKCSRNHGQSKSPIYQLVHHAKRRAKDKGLDFDLDWRQLTIPETCPLLNIPLLRGKGEVCDNSPTIDRIIPSKGYVMGNVFIISHKANRMKSDATLDEIMTFADNYHAFIMAI